MLEKNEKKYIQYYYNQYDTNINNNNTKVTILYYISYLH